MSFLLALGMLGNWQLFWICKLGLCWCFSARSHSFSWIRQALQNWPAIKCYFIEQGGDAYDIILQLIQDQDNELNEDTSSLTLPEYNLYCLHNIMHLFHTFVSKLEGNSISVTNIHKKSLSISL
jgi:hypothetical protein